MTATLEERVQKMEDVLEIMNMQAIYASYLDKGYASRTMNPKKAAEFYMADGFWEHKAAGILAKGHEQIAGVFDHLDKTGEFYMHAFTTPIITVNGKAAYAEWLMLVGHIVEGKVVLTYASENIEYVKTESGWLIQTNRFSAAEV